MVLPCFSLAQCQLFTIHGFDLDLNVLLGDVFRASWTSTRGRWKVTRNQTKNGSTSTPVTSITSTSARDLAPQRTRPRFLDCVERYLCGKCWIELAEVVLIVPNHDSIDTRYASPSHKIKNQSG